MKGVLFAVAREYRLIFRNGITVYLVLAPALLALVFLFVFGRAQRADIAFVVDGSVPPEIVSKLEEAADILRADNLDSLLRRVGGADSIAGVSLQDGSYKLYVEGNEPAGFAEARRSVLDAVLAGGVPVYLAEAIEGGKSLAYDISSACILLLALFIGGAALGLSGVTERESGVVRAYLISPLSLAGYTVSKLLPALLFGLVSVLICALVMGGAGAALPYLLLALSGAFVCGIVTFLIIALADNQIAAVGVLKILMPVFLMVGISAAFVPQRLLAIYYPLPMYWQYEAIKALGAGASPAFPMLMTLATGLPWFLVVMAVFVKKTAMRVWR